MSALVTGFIALAFYLFNFFKKMHLKWPIGLTSRAPGLGSGFIIDYVVCFILFCFFDWDQILF